MRQAGTLEFLSQDCQRMNNEDLGQGSVFGVVHELNYSFFVCFVGIHITGDRRLAGLRHVEVVLCPVTFCAWGGHFYPKTSLCARA
ncbi:MAG: hypothetical protein ACK55Z_13160 [bacterium]